MMVMMRGELRRVEGKKARLIYSSAFDASSALSGLSLGQPSLGSTAHRETVARQRPPSACLLPVLPGVNPRVSISILGMVILCCTVRGQDPPWPKASSWAISGKWEGEALSDVETWRVKAYGPGSLSCSRSLKLRLFTAMDWADWGLQSWSSSDHPRTRRHRQHRRTLAVLCW